MVNENGDCRSITLSSPDEGYDELNVSGLMSSASEYILSDTTKTPEKKSNSGI